MLNPIQSKLMHTRMKANYTSGGGLVKQAMFGYALSASVQSPSPFSALLFPVCTVQSFGASLL
jgi:hypothetical protein